MQLLKKIPLYLFLLVLFFCLHGSAENYGYINAGEVVEVGLIALLCIAVCFVMLWLFSKNYLQASLITFFMALWYLFFGAIHDFIKNSLLQFLQSYSILLPLLIVINIAVIWWLKRNKQLHVKLALYLNVLFILFCLADGFMLLNRHFNFKESAMPHAVNFNKAAAAQKPNVYFLMFDEYAGYKSLQDSFNFKNDSLYHFLKNQNFKELPTFANYDFTPFSMSSILNMQYVPENYTKHSLTQPDIQNRFGEIRNAQLFSIFRSMGYDIENFSIFDIKDRPALYQYMGLFPIHAGLLTNKIFHNRLKKNIGWWFISVRFSIPALKEPKFSYAHFFLPHGQFYRDSSGNFNPPEKILDLKYLADKSLYLSYLKYTNNIIKGLVKDLNQTDPGAIVIIMSDHGFYDYNNPGDYDPYNFDNICFVRMPGGKPQPDSLPHSNVNVFRYIFNTGYGQKFPYVKDSPVYVI